mmetsp:Transcript_8973/g.40765  ORF Transcript_8973/g.40765 Transcript_8973/m.40765 type:complete len:316 (+) Transcript_8973:235-1182(+)
MSSPTPHKSDSGMRRSALSAAFEELALRPTTANDETDGFSAHITYDAAGNVCVTENEQTLEAHGAYVGSPAVNLNLGSSNHQMNSGAVPALLRRLAAGVDDDEEARSYGRQHGSSVGINMLAMASASEDKTLGGHADVEQNPPGTPQKSEWSSYLKSDDCVSPTRVKNGGFRFSIDAGRPEGAGVVVTHKATESVDMAYSWNPGTVLGVGGSEKPAGVATSSRKVPIGGGDSTRAPGPIDGELARTMAKVVVVHPPHEEEDECCEMSAGRTQRGSFSSLLLLEAQELFDTMETVTDSPEEETIETADRVAIAAAN